MKNLVLELLSQLDPAEAARTSFLDYHASGFDYLCLHRTDELTIKLYMSDPLRLVPCGEADYLVQPHDHNYNFKTHVIAGRVRHYVFEPQIYSESETTGTHHRLSYYWRERRFDLAAPWARYSMQAMVQTHDPGASYFLTHDVVHTISIDPDHPTCLLLFQFTDRLSKRFTSLYTRSPDAPRTEGLYRVPTLHEVERLRARAQEFLL